MVSFARISEVILIRLVIDCFRQYKLHRSQQYFRYQRLESISTKNKRIKGNIRHFVSKDSFWSVSPEFQRWYWFGRLSIVFDNINYTEVRNTLDINAEQFLARTTNEKKRIKGKIRHFVSKDSFWSVSPEFQRWYWFGRWAV